MIMVLASLEADSFRSDCARNTALKSALGRKRRNFLEDAREEQQGNRQTLYSRLLFLREASLNPKMISRTEPFSARFYPRC